MMQMTDLDVFPLLTYLAVWRCWFFVLHGDVLSKHKLIPPFFPLFV